MGTRTVAESWLAAALARTNGSTKGYVLNGHVGPAEVQAVLSEYLLELVRKNAGKHA